MFPSERGVLCESRTVKCDSIGQSVGTFEAEATIRLYSRFARLLQARASFSFTRSRSIVSLTDGALAKLPSIGADDAFILTRLSSRFIFRGLTVIEVVIANHVTRVEIRAARALTQAEEKKPRDDADGSTSKPSFARAAPNSTASSSPRLASERRFSNQRVQRASARWVFPIAHAVACVSIRASFVGRVEGERASAHRSIGRSVVIIIIHHRARVDIGRAKRHTARTHRINMYKQYQP